jgi:hypothetical protein
MTFVRKTGGRVHLAGPAVEKLLVHRQLQDSSPEAGGVMLGRLILGTSDVIVDAVTGPCTEDKYQIPPDLVVKSQSVDIVEVI